MKQPSVALGIIVRSNDDDLPALRRMLESVAPYVDAIYANLNHRADQPVSRNVERLLKRHNAHIEVTNWVDDFAGARNYIFNKIPKQYDWLLWLDADDVVENPEKIKEVLARVPERISGLYVNYDYQHDEFGNCTFVHKVIRVCRNNGKYHWKSSFDDTAESVHETLQAKLHADNGMTTDWKVVHNSSATHTQESLRRNISILERMHNRMAAKGKVDPRVIYYLGVHSYDLGELRNAEQYLLGYLEVSGFAAERCEAWLHLGLIWRRHKREDAARQAFLRAIAESPMNPKPYVELGELEYIEKRLAESEEWLKMSIEKQAKDSDMLNSPLINSYRAYMLLVRTYLDMGPQKLDEAAELAAKALEVRPFDENAQALQELVLKVKDERDNTRAFGRIAALVDDRLKLVELMPDSMQDNPAVVAMRQLYSKPQEWGNKEVAIYVGESLQGIFSPKDLDKGMGGSEEAVIRLSRELADKGWGVTVYANCGANAGMDTWEGHNEDGYVVWKQYWEFNPKDKFNVLVGWRNPWFYDRKYTAKKTFLWLHDVMDKEEFTSERLKNIDGVLFVSQYHADLYSDVISDNKRIASGNGIEPQEFESLDDIHVRDAHRCIYTSSQLRGLEVLVDIWPEVRKAIPDATLDCYYGWETFDEANRNHAGMMAWKQTLVNKINKTEGVTDRGRLGQRELNEELFKSGIYAYPCIFQEVYCISLIKAQAAGCYPVTSDYAVLDDYNITGTKVHYVPDMEKFEEFKKKYTTRLISALKNERKPAQTKVKQIRRDFSWQKVAEQWNKLFEGE